jgi:hypothetical protein
VRPRQRGGTSVACQNQRKRHVVRQIEVREDVKGFEYKADVVAAQRGAGVVIQIRQILALHGNAACVGSIQASHQVRRLDFHTDSPMMATNSPGCKDKSRLSNSIRPPGTVLRRPVIEGLER